MRWSGLLACDRAMSYLIKSEIGADADERLLQRGAAYCP